MPTFLDLPLRIILVDPPANVAYCLQRTSRADCTGHTRSGAGDLAFELTLQVKPGGELPDFRGPFILGPRGDRHIAILIGTLAGDADSCWTRAAKIRLKQITWDQINEVQSRPGALLIGRFVGTAPRGGPACATTHFVGDGWTVDP